MKKYAFFRSVLALLLCLSLVLPFVPARANAADLDSTQTTTDCSHAFGNWIQTKAPDCTEAGELSRTCSLCKVVETKPIEAMGHDYTAENHAADCQDYAYAIYTCSRCGDSYKAYDEARYTPWQETKPDVDESLIQSKVQYRYSDYETIVTDQSVMDGYELVSSEWIETDSGSVSYVNSWPTGFDTTSELYSQYNNKADKVTASETKTEKTVVHSDEVTGYLYYHWCHANSFFSQPSKSGNYTLFHAYYDTTDPSAYICDYTDMSYDTGNACCTNSTWFFVTEVSEQKYTSYRNEYTYARWTDFSNWGDTEIAATDTRKVETRTLYRYLDAELGEHSYHCVIEGGNCQTPGTAVYTCTVCGDSYTEEASLGGHDYVDGVCTLCGDEEPDYYLFGYINGANYACEEDHENMGEYKFVDGQLVVTFTQASYVGIKTEGNVRWYMTDGWQGDTTTSVTLYNTSNLGDNADKLYVPGGMEITFTLSYNNNDTLTLSYTSDQCIHTYVETVITAATCTEAGLGKYTCSKCGDEYEAEIPATGHSILQGACQHCDYVDESYVPVTYYLYGYINGNDYGSEGDFENRGEFRFEEGKLLVVFSQDSYVAVKREDNSVWYNTDGWLGYDVTSAKLYNNQTLSNPDKMFVPAYQEVMFTLEELPNDVLQLSYTATPCKHNYQDTVITEAGCETTGLMKRECIICTYTVEAEIPVAGHDYVAEVVAPGCITNGYTLHTCSRCGDSYQDTTTAATGHDYQSSVTVEPGCETDGEILYTCSICNHSYSGKISANGHSYTSQTVKPGCETKGHILYTCSGCGDTYTIDTDPALGHSYTSQTTKIPTCTEAGVMTYTCERCGHSYEDVLEAFGHNYISEATPPTCDAEGYTTHSCSICGYSYADTLVPALGHDYKDGFCTVCGEEDPSLAPPSYYLFGYINGADYACEGDHENMGVYEFKKGTLVATFTQDSYVAVKLEDNAAWYMTNEYVTDTTATLYNTTTLGETANKMFVPGGLKITFTLTVNEDDTLTLSYVTAPCEHSFSSQVTTEPGCETEGVLTLTCEYCGVTETQAIEPTGHGYVSTVVAPTCTEKGYTTHTCAGCGDSYTDSEIPATGHKTESQVTKEPGCETDGVMVYTCTVCGHSYEAKIEATGHEYQSTVTAPGCETEGYTTYTCHCGDTYKDDFTAATGHSYKGETTVAPGCETEGTMTYTCEACGDSYDEPLEAIGHNFISEAVKPTCEKNGYTIHTCTVCGYSHSDTVVPAPGHLYSTVTTKEPTCEEPGERISTCATCGEVYTESVAALGHKNETVTVDATCTEAGSVTSTCTVCQKVTVEELPALGHSFVKGVCTTCGYVDPDYVEVTYYLFGYINGANYACEEDHENLGEYKFEDGKLTATFTETSYVAVKTGDNASWYMTDGWQGEVDSVVLYNTGTLGETADKLYIPSGVEVTFTLTVNEDGTLTLSYTTATCAHSYQSTVLTAPTCTAEGLVSYTCSKCNDTYQETVPAAGHKYVMGVCKVCGAVDEDYVTPDYYLFGFINGANYGCEEDHENLGEYKFENGSLTATFTQDSYIAIKTGDNAIWYMADGWQGEGTSFTTLYDSTTLEEPDKIFVPGGVTVVFTMTENPEGTLSLSYITKEIEPSVAPTISLKYPAVTFEDVITMNVFFSAENLQDVVEMGLITYKNSVAEWNVDNAEFVIPGYVWDETQQFYAARTQGIPAKDMGDDLYFAVYAKLADGTYTYTRLVSYSPAKYAYGLLGDPSMSSLVISLLNYGAAAQVYFGYKTDSLMNATLTAEQQASIETYRADMMAGISTPSAAKAANFTRTSTGFASRYPTITFDGAFCIDYFCTPNQAVSGDITLYYWDQTAFDACDVLSVDNATGALTMVNENGSYATSVEGIAAKDLDKGVYVAFVYSDGTNTYCSGILGYSIGVYCVSLATGGDTMADFAQATAVYGYYAKQMFN